MNWVLSIYDWLSGHKRLLCIITVAVAAALAVISLSINFSEDITDFLPDDNDYKESLEVYERISDAGKIVIIFEGSSPDVICAAIDSFSAIYPAAHSSVDFQEVSSRLEFAYSHIPYLLTEKDYTRLERILNGDSIYSIFSSNAELLESQGTEFVQTAITADPLHLVDIRKALGSKYSEMSTAFTSYGGYMMTSDSTMGFAFVDTGSGGLETADNAAIVDSVDNAIAVVSAGFPDLNVRSIGAPVVAEGNARCIKRDSILALSISMLLIVALLLYSFPRKRDIALIVLSVGFGWLCGMAVLALCFKSVSLIVIGIGSVLIGIAVNYPLHVLVHRRYVDSVKQTVIEIVKPLTVGNITTVAAFAALLFVDSPALRQLGVFASTMLIGTILFCIFTLPHLLGTGKMETRDIPLPSFSAKFRRGASVVVCVLFVAALFVPSITDRPLFDSNVSNINYLTPQQREDFAYFESLSAVSDEPAYTLSTARAELDARVERWNSFWGRRDISELSAIVASAADSAGFSSDTFDSFIQLISQPYTGEDLADTETLASLWPGRFDTVAFNSAVSTSISDNFDFIGLVCSAVVLIFLCICFRSLFVGVAAFIPMAVSWVLIIAVMMLAGLQFNIVNVILATFIFGQGDDYTIFIVEGLLYERRTGRQMLPQYRQSILLSALIMLISMGVLAVSAHPAMHSLGVVTLIGMTSVVLMAIIIPPMLFSVGGRIKFVNRHLS